MSINLVINNIEYDYCRKSGKTLEELGEEYERVENTLKDASTWEKKAKIFHQLAVLSRQRRDFTLARDNAFEGLSCGPMPGDARHLNLELLWAHLANNEYLSARRLATRLLKQLSPEDVPFASLLRLGLTKACRMTKKINETFKREYRKEYKEELTEDFTDAVTIALSGAENTKDPQLKAFFLLQLARAYVMDQELEKALKKVNEAIAIAQTVPLISKLAHESKRIQAQMKIGSMDLDAIDEGDDLTHVLNGYKMTGEQQLLDSLIKGISSKKILERSYVEEMLSKKEFIVDPAIFSRFSRIYLLGIDALKKNELHKAIDCGWACWKSKPNSEKAIISALFILVYAYNRLLLFEQAELIGEKALEYFSKHSFYAEEEAKICASLAHARTGLTKHKKAITIALKGKEIFSNCDEEADQGILQNLNYELCVAYRMNHEYKLAVETLITLIENIQDEIPSSTRNKTAAWKELNVCIDEEIRFLHQSGDLEKFGKELWAKDRHVEARVYLVINPDRVAPLMKEIAELSSDEDEEEFWEIDETKRASRSASPQIPTRRKNVDI